VHFPQVAVSSDDVQLERYLRACCVLGSAFNTSYPIAANKTFHRLIEKNRYRRYFTNRAKLDKIGGEKFVGMAELGGVYYTNEYMFSTVLRTYVEAAVAEACDKLMEPYL
jgi:hypothetical protein